MGANQSRKRYIHNPRKIIRPTTWPTNRNMALKKIKYHPKTGKKLIQNTKPKQVKIPKTSKQLVELIEANSSTTEMDTTVLFEKFTVEEVKDIEKKTRADIERKKEDLRLMVGERYRDLIEAADTISEMKFSAENVQKSVSRMQNLCQNLRQTQIKIQPSTTSPVSVNRHSGHQLYSVAARIKLLIEVPEKIWMCIENNAFLQATRLYLLARHINSVLQKETLQNGVHVVHHFPILTRQWSMISHFNHTILKLCRDKISEGMTDDQIVAGCLCSILLLEDSTVRQVFNEFLTLRLAAVTHLVSPDQSGLTIKHQITSVTSMLVTTLHQVYTLFYGTDTQNTAGPACNLLQDTFQQTINLKMSETLKDFNNTIAFKHLPASVTEFVPQTSQAFKPIDQKSLAENTLQWLQMCVKTTNHGLSKLLVFVTTVKALSSIKTAVWETLKEDDRMSTWDTVCTCTVGHPVPVWEEFLEKLFTTRVKALVKTQMDKALDKCTQQIETVLQQLELVDNSALSCDHNVSSYIWYEGSQDVLPNSAWVSVASRSARTNMSPLVMKARAFTPTVQNLCSNFDKKLQHLLSDLNHYTDHRGDATVSKTATSADTSKHERGQLTAATDGVGPFDRYADRQAIDSYLQSGTEQVIRSLLENLREKLKGYEEVLKEECSLEKCRFTLDKCVLLARFSSALFDLSSNLQHSIQPTQKADTSVKSIKRTSMQTSFQPVLDKRLAQVKTTLVDFTNETFTFWSKVIARYLVAEFQANLVDVSNESVAKASMSWDVIEIQEETEDGKSIKSTIRIPMQVSWYVQALLYRVCTELNKIGGHSLNRSILQTLTNDLYMQCATVYDQHLTDLLADKKPMNDPFVHVPFCQSRALQMLFDIKFINTVLLSSGDKSIKKSQQLLERCIDRVEGKIDPFDLDVFSPYLQTNLMRHVQRSQVMYGSLGTLDRLSSLSAAKPPPAGYQEQHNVLTLSSCQNRFPMLPITTQSRPTNVHLPILPSPITKAAPGPLSPALPPPNRNASTGSFFESVTSSIWFSKAEK